ncbi:amino acid permease [Mesoplasma photuris]|uniref:amino acid permease n=1 Tax=Mesoplasma photuris TaxID=217731 RepID=UPI0004E1FC6C|nr:amino acid permease [Mesoplasma photuris]
MKKLTNKFGFWTTLAMTLTATIGSSLLISFNQVMFLSKENWIFMIIAWVIGAIIIIPENLMMAEAGASYKMNGASYGWVKRANWNVLAFWFGWVLISMVSAASIASVSMATGDMIASIVNNKDVLAVGSYESKAVGIGILIVLAVTQMFIKNSKKIMQHLFTVMTMLPIAFILIMAMVYGNLHQNTETSQEINQSMSQIFLASGLLIPAITFTSYGYSGTEVSIFMAQDIEKAEKNVPKVIASAIAIIVVIYVLFGLALLTLAPTSALGDPNSKVPDILNIPDWAKLTFQILAIFLFVGSLSSFLVYQTAFVVKLSEEKEIGKIFQKRNKIDSAWVATLLLIAMASVYVFTSNLFSIISYFTMATSLLKFLTFVTIIHLRRTDKEYRKIWNNKVFWTFAISSILFAILTFSGSIMAQFYMSSDDDVVIKSLISQSIVLGVVLLLIPIGIVKTKIMNKKNNNLANK